MTECLYSGPRNLSHLTQYTIPAPETCLEQQKLLEMVPPLRFNHSIVIGRFQPVHYGHLYLMKWAAKLADYFTIGIGSVNKINRDNPYTFQERTRMLLEALSNEGLIKQLNNIVPLWDYQDDDQLWFKQTLSKVGRIDVVLGNNPWVNNIFQANKIPAIEVPLLNRKTLEGKKIRAELRQNHLLD